MVRFKPLPLLKWVILCLACVCLCACSGNRQKQAITQFDDAMKALNEKAAYHCISFGSTTDGMEKLQSEQKFWVCGPEYLYIYELHDTFLGYLGVDGAHYGYNANTSGDGPMDIWVEKEEPYELHPWAGIFDEASRETQFLSVKEENGNRVIQVLRGEETFMDGYTYSPVTLTMTLDAEQNILSLHLINTFVSEDLPEIVFTMEAGTEFLSYDSEEIRQVIHSQLK